MKNIFRGYASYTKDQKTGSFDDEKKSFNPCRSWPSWQRQSSGLESTGSVSSRLNGQYCTIR